MTPQESRDLAREINLALKHGEYDGAPVAKPEKPALAGLPEAAAAAKTREYEQARERRIDYLLAKRGLTPDEQAELASAVAEWARSGRG